MNLSLVFILFLCVSIVWSDSFHSAKELLSQMTLTEKISMMSGIGGDYVGNIPGVPRLGIPPISMNDGPQGFRDDARPGTTTSFPSGMTIAATFNASAAKIWGMAMAKEFYSKGANVQLGPGMNVARVPTGGRNFEYISGESSYLGAKLAPAAIEGIQSQYVMANAKHFILNNQETDRMTVSANIDERTLFEIYYPPFAASAAVGVASFMCSYNRVNDTYSCENEITLQQLKIDSAGAGFPFSGWIMSDWGACHSLSVKKGLDQEMPFGFYLSSTAIVDALNSGTLTQNDIDEAVLRMLVPMFSLGLINRVNSGSIQNDVTSEAHNEIARTLSASSTVLLKNANGLLPLSPSAPIRIAFFGSAAYDAPIAGGYGSGHVTPKYIISPLEGVASVLGIELPVNNCTVNSFLDGTDFYQPGAPSESVASVMDCCARCSSRRDCKYFTYKKSVSLCYFKQTSDGRRSDLDSISSTCNSLTQSNWFCNAANQCVSYANGQDADAVAALAEEADVIFVGVGTTSVEGIDRANLSLPDGQDDLIFFASKFNKKVIVGLQTPGALLTPWRNHVDAIVTNFMPGQENGRALADILFGFVNPAGRSPLTFPNVENEMNLLPGQFPGINKEATYSERLLVGYLWYLQNGVTPAFCFGHGLSYTTFNYSAAVVEVFPFDTVSHRVNISLNISNSGAVQGVEVVQLYLEFPFSYGEPLYQLKGFFGVNLYPSETQLVTFNLNERDLSIWDVNTHNWLLARGNFSFFLGSSSCDARVKAIFQI